MNFLEQIIIPPTAEHNTLLNIIQVFSYLMFYPFTAMITGGLILSVYYNRKGIKSGNPVYTMFARDLITKLTVSRNAGYSMILIPGISIAIIYAQFLYSANVITNSMIIISLIIYFIGLIYTFKFRNSFELRHILDKAASSNDEVKQFEEKLFADTNRFGSLAMWLFLLASFLFMASATVAGNMSDWSAVNNIIQLLTNGTVWLNFLYFLISSFSISTIVALFFLFSWNGGIKFENTEYESLAGKNLAVTALVSTIVLPVFLFLSTILLPKEAISAGVLLFSGLAIIGVLLICNFLYAILKNGDTKYSGLTFVFLILLLVFVVIKNQLAFSNAVKTHLVTVNAKAENILKEKLPKTNKIAEVSGEDIFKGRCSACHKFDVKLVGPPYKETVPKYNGDVKKLAQYIYNPTKVNPDYPPMPNQGIKMKEAEAVAKYILEQLNK